MKCKFSFLIQCHKFYFFFLLTLLHILHFFLASSPNLRLFFPFLVTMSILNLFLHHYIFCISLYFLHDEVYIFFLLASSQNLHLLSISSHHVVYIQPRPKPSSMKFFLPFFLPSFLSFFPPCFLSTNHRDYIYFYWISSEID
jgi:hypothetical protein